MRLHANCIIVHYRIIVTGFGGLQRVLHGEFEQVKAGVTLGASPQITSDGSADRFDFISSFAWVGCKRVVPFQTTVKRLLRIDKEKDEI